MRFEVGDIVKISRDSKWYGYNSRNPRDTIGKIGSIDDWIGVWWDTDCNNSYEEEDLKLVRKGDRNEVN